MLCHSCEEGYNSAMAKRTEDLKSVIAALIAEHKWNDLRAKMAGLQPADIADLLLKLPKRERVLLFRALPRELAADSFSELEHEDAQYFLHELSDDETRVLLTELEPDDRTELLEELPGVVVQKLLNLLEPKDRAKTQAILGYPEESVGRLMTPGYVALRPTWTASEALAHVRKRDPKSETVNVLYVTDESWHLLGVLNLRKLIFADPEARVESFMQDSVIKGMATDDREKAAALMGKYNFSVLPVVDKDNILVGIVTVDDVMDVVEEEMTEDFYRSAAVESFKMNLGSAGVRTLYGGRIGWLVVLVLINIISGATIAFYQETIENAIVLVSFLPLLIASAGNAGSQSATLAIRALATGDIRVRDWLRVTSKELAVAGALGGTMGFVVWWIGVWRAGPEIALVVTLTMMTVVMAGSLFGISLPFLLRKLKLDPAVASAPLVATISDVLGVIIYFALATWLLSL